MKGMKYTLIILCMLVLPCAVNAGTSDEAEALFRQGLASYEQDDYETAIEALKQATELDEQQSTYFHYLGRSYGHLAAQSNWFRAIELSNKTRLALEKAVELDGGNLKAMRDLIKYYRQAPAFLGGDESKAEALEKAMNARSMPAGTETALK